MMFARWRWTVLSLITSSLAISRGEAVDASHRWEGATRRLEGGREGSELHEGHIAAGVDAGPLGLARNACFSQWLA